MNRPNEGMYALDAKRHGRVRRHPDIQVVSEGKVIQDSNLITSGGVSSGINMGLYLVEKTIGKTASERTATTIEFEYKSH
ncbi:hypothetical protein [Lysinibacillus pakistanensis]|uniref:DJ-1/PfpI domain-containing protein n=1 Tax=Lysinibacillus pakistanensis TaxID=759811 RepID=A0AAX3X3Q2_9BACI|nr:hypothetical protein [Lysinibacillus pakistanensis]MDM5233460.1 hypothetical protein [Lysinibacillus pakistanensis]WHY48931.1 hypothetical protein QNH22_12125 [Lysinibacillus pakistanensis]WHY53942.1 hypothetical protein QNH24_12105 [Lysinibacillus pakistanensis]